MYIFHGILKTANVIIVNNTYVHILKPNKDKNQRALKQKNYFKELNMVSKYCEHYTKLAHLNVNILAFSSSYTIYLHIFHMLAHSCIQAN